MSIHKIMAKSGPRYKAVIQVSPKKQICRVFSRKIDAEAWEQNQKGLLRTEPQASVNAGMTVADLASYWLENYANIHKAASSVLADSKLLKHHVLTEFAHRKLADLTPRETELWMNRLRTDKHLSPKTCNHCLGLLRKMLNDAVRWQFIRFNPIACVRPFRFEQQDFAFWTKEEIVTFLCHAKTHEPDFFPVFAVALYTGMRKGELRGLKWDCIALDQKLIIVKRSFCDATRKMKETTKSKRIRHVPINESLMEVLMELNQKRDSEFVLPKFNYHHCYRTMQRVSQAAGVRTIRFHDMRHTFASHFMMSGGVVYDLQKILGHATVTMTERYSHMSPNHLAGKTEILDFGTRAQENVVRLADFRRS